MKRETRIRLMERKVVELLIQGKSTREVMGILGIGYRKLSKIKVKAHDSGYLSGAVPLPAYPESLFPDTPIVLIKSSEADCLLLARKPWIEERLSAGWSPITVFEELKLSVGRSSFYRFLHRHALDRESEFAKQRVVPEILHKPGEALILDWGKLRDVIDPETGKKRILWAFVGVLGFSRYMCVRLVWSNETKITLKSIEEMFREIGGVPFKVTSDNPKCFSLEASLYEPLLNPCFERFATHYGTVIECLPPRDPQKKGKVERLMTYVRRLYEAHGNEWLGLEESQAYMDKKIAIANERKHGTTGLKPIDQLLLQEVSTLKPLPALAYEIEDVVNVEVRKDGHVRFANKYYSLDEKHIGQSALVVGDSQMVSIYITGKLVEVHSRITDPNQSKSTKPLHLKPWERAMQDDSIYRKRARDIGANVERLITIILGQGQGYIDTRKVWGILSLDKSYKKEAIDKACSQAIEMGSYSYRMIKSILKLSSDSISQKQTKTLELTEKNVTDTKKENKFPRPLTVYEEQLSLLIH